MKPKFLHTPQSPGTPKRLAVLTEEEDQYWEHVFTEYMNDGRDEDEADEQAWLDCQEMFPRLKDFDGCEPEPASRKVKSSERLLLLTEMLNADERLSTPPLTFATALMHSDHMLGKCARRSRQGCPSPPPLRPLLPEGEVSPARHHHRHADSNSLPAACQWPPLPRSSATPTPCTASYGLATALHDSLHRPLRPMYRANLATALSLTRWGQPGRLAAIVTATGGLSDHPGSATRASLAQRWQDFACEQIDHTTTGNNTALFDTGTVHRRDSMPW